MMLPRESHVELTTYPSNQHHHHRGQGKEDRRMKGKGVVTALRPLILPSTKVSRGGVVCVGKRCVAMRPAVSCITISPYLIDRSISSASGRRQARHLEPDGERAGHGADAAAKRAAGRL
jgi:hypothetical protein